MIERQGAVLFLAVFISLIMLFSLPQASANAERQLEVSLGGQRLLKLGETIDRIAIADPATIDVKVISSRELRVLGQKEGATDLTIWYTGGNSLSYRVVVGVDLRGLRAEMARDPDLASVRAVETGSGVVLQGEVTSLAAQQRARKIARTWLGKDVSDSTVIADQRMVAVEIRFAAVSTSTLKALGMNFQSLDNNFNFAALAPGGGSGFGYQGGNYITTHPNGDFGAGLAPDTNLPVGQAFNLLMAWPGSNIIGVISALSNANLAQLLAEPTLLVRSGEDAEFLAGGEIPIPVPQGGSGSTAVTIEYRKFGVQLGVEATVLANDRIVLKVRPEVSELDYSNAVTMQGFRIPALRTRSTRTTIELGSGQSFVLAGLMYSSSGNVDDRVPVLGELPVIGTFFKRTQNARERQELIIVATPRLVSPMEAGSIPPLPGEGIAHDDHFSNTLFNVNTLSEHITRHGLMR